MSKDFDFETLPAIKVIPFADLNVRLHPELRFGGVYAFCVKAGDSSKGMVYIGSSGWLQRRFIGHRSALNNNSHHAQILQNIYNTYGHDSLEVRLIEFLTKSEEETPFGFRKRMFEREQFWLDFVPRKCLLNGTPTAGSQQNRVRTEDEKNKTGQGVKEFYANNPEARLKSSSRIKKMWEDPEHREYIRMTTAKSWESESVREARSLGIRRSAATPEAKERRSLATKANWQREGYKESMGSARVLMWQKKEYRQVISAARRAAWQDPEHRAIQSESRKASYVNNPSRKEALSRSGRKNWEDPELRERMTNALKERMSKPEEKEKKSTFFKDLWADPDYRQETSQSILKGQASKSDALIFVSPDGQMYVTDNATAFAEKFGLIQTCMSALARGTQKKHKGWTGYTASSWESVPNYAIRILSGDHSDLAEYQEMTAVEQAKNQRRVSQEKQSKLDQQAHDSLCLRLKTLGSKSEPIIYISPLGEKYVSDVPSQFATEMGFEIEGQRHKFSLIIRTEKSYKGWTGYKLKSWVDVPNDTIRVLWGDHPDLPEQKTEEPIKQPITPVQLSFNL